MYMHFGFDVVASVPVAGYLQGKALETHTVVLAHSALEVLAQDIAQASPQKRHECRAVFTRRLCKFQVELRESPDWIQQLALSTDSFLIARPLLGNSKGESVIAGYPWFGDRGRDTMVALPGLTLATGRYESARNILQTFANFIDQGMLPNVFPGSGKTPEYNTVDAALWYIEAWRAYGEATDDWTDLRKIFPVLEDIIRWYSQGTRYGIALDGQDGLLKAGEPGVQLTWMDAKVGDWVVTPRMGKPVEINALWYNALETIAQFAHKLQVPSKLYETQAVKTRLGFQRFINPANGGLFDVLDGSEGEDAALRPNQILAVSLPYSPCLLIPNKPSSRCAVRPY
jgi:predicted glycogen debranching enzyme